MTWHKDHRSDDGIMRLVVDSPAVAHIEESWPEFTRDPRHVRLGLASDGVPEVDHEFRRLPSTFGGGTEPIVARS
ncbi:hypothetical protein R1sor_000104 [Riccia sorocarpa]|uniref:Uncharacterized protein n=1 Tax=Riccia sorocarpa TaxID=122646 RepID=A0ABD3GS53_9MARC